MSALVFPLKDRSRVPGTSSSHLVPWLSDHGGKRVIRASQVSYLEHFDFKVDSGRKAEGRKNVRRLAAGFDDVDQPLVNSHFKLISRVLVNEG